MTLFFDEIKQMRQGHQSLATVIDVITDDILEYIANKYEKLYHSVEDESNIVYIEMDLTEIIKAERICRSDHHWCRKRIIHFEDETGENGSFWTSLQIVRWTPLPYSIRYSL